MVTVYIGCITNIVYITLVQCYKVKTDHSLVKAIKPLYHPSYYFNQINFICYEVNKK